MERMKYLPMPSNKEGTIISLVYIHMVNTITPK